MTVTIATEHSILAHFEPLYAMALQRFVLNSNNWTIVNTDGDERAAFVAELSSLYSAPHQFDKRAFEAFSTSCLLEYLERTHAFYENELLPKLEHLAASVADGDNLGYALEVLVKQFRRQLVSHMREEEDFVFPAARRMHMGGGTEWPAEAAHHDDDALNLIATIVDLTNNSRGATRHLNQLATAFSVDLALHHRVEEEVLWPRLSALAKGSIPAPMGEV